MDFLTWDLETYYAQDYSLDFMTTEAYVRDPRFELILGSFKFNDTPAFWILPDRFDKFVREEIDWANTILCGHHSHFDGYILNHHYGQRPAMHIDTLSMARVIDGPKAGNGLAALLVRHGLGEKGRFITYAKGKRLKGFTKEEIHDYGAYCCNDTEGTYKLALEFLPQFPDDELALIDLTVRLFTEPVFQGDVAKLDGAVVSERARKRELLTKLGYECKTCAGLGQTFNSIPPRQPGVSSFVDAPCKSCDGTGVDRKPFASSEKFAAILRSIGIEPPMKPSPTVKDANGVPEMIYAFAKSDPDMQALADDPDEVVAALAGARLAVKSTIIETRAQRFADSARRGPMPVYISYGAAHTFRWGGGDSMNWQNLSNYNANRPEMSVIQASILPPPGHRIVRTDSGQGEARIVAWNAGQEDLIQAFREGRDVYSEHASTIYGRPVDRRRVKEDYIPGQLGKVSILGMGFGMGWYKASMELLKGMLGAPPIQFTEADMGVLAVDPSRFLNNPKKVQQVDAMPSRLELAARLIHCAVTETLVLRYRGRFLRIPKYWDFMNQVIDAMITGDPLTFGANGCMRAEKEKIWMPNGLALHYRGISRDESGEASYFNGRSRVRVHGPLLTENTTQSLHRIIVAGQMLEIAAAGLKVALMRHDDVVCAVPENCAEDALAYMIQVMSKAPAWAQGLPLVGDGGVGTTLLGAK